MEAFIDYQKRNAIKIIFPPFNFTVLQNSHGLQTGQKFVITVETIEFEKNLLQIRLTDACNQTRIYICTIDAQMYERIRYEQSLNVSFQGFRDHLIRILDSCKREELLMSLVKEDNGHILQIYEKRSFKNLTHLYLIMQEAPSEAILYHINQTLSISQEQVHALSSQINVLQRDLNARDHNIAELHRETSSLKAKLNEQEHLIFNRNTEEVSRLQQTIKHITEAKEAEEKRLKIVINEQQTAVDTLLKEKYTLNDKLAQEARKIETVHNENSRIRSRYNALKDDNAKLLSDIEQYHSRDERNEAVLIQLRKQTIELQTQVKAGEKQQSGLRAELDAERNICQTKKQALEMAMQDIAKYNELIGRQNKDMTALREKVKTRTEVAINQEQFVKRIEKENAELNGQLKVVFSEHVEQKRQQDELKLVLDNVQKMTGQLEEKYQKRIAELLAQISEASSAGKNGFVQSHQRGPRPLRHNNHQQYY